VAAWLESVLPHRLQTFEALYASWIERVGSRTATRRERHRFGPRIRRLVMLLVLDTVVLLGVVLATGLFQVRAEAWLLRTFTELDPAWAEAAVVIAAFERALPPREGVDLSLAPRRMLIVALQLPILIVTGLPLLAATGALAPILTIGLLVSLALYESWQVWRSAGDLHAHVNAGAQAIVEVLAAQGRASPHGHGDAAHIGAPPADHLAVLDSMLPGLGSPTAVRVAAGSALVGLTLGDSNLRGLTGATVLAIQRGEHSIPVPTAADTLEVGDLLALAGSTDAIESATRLLSAPEAAAH
jgi:CPA2 family monovalent cation:H+ antiporter-2